MRKKRIKTCSPAEAYVSLSNRYYLARNACFKLVIISLLIIAALFAWIFKLERNLAESNWKIVVLKQKMNALIAEMESVYDANGADELLKFIEDGCKNKP